MPPSKFRLPTLTRIPGAGSIRRLTESPPDVIQAPHEVLAATSVTPAAKPIQENLNRAQKATEISNDEKEFDPEDFYITNAKQVVSVLIGGKMLGESAARDAFRGYLAFIKGLPGVYKDFVSFTYDRDQSQLAGIISLLNSSTHIRLPFLAPLDVNAVKCGQAILRELPIEEFIVKHRIPLLASSTADLLIFGIVNPTLADGLRHALVGMCPELAQARIDFLILTPDELKQATAQE